ncbi:hypothetical protein [uncultured Thiodictyon sp.]|uniref:hypothetical protein n=1 Tax=uncultured Thiodictyon sp. TaxID=1846217 RepID=UPI0025E97BAD|nr:hypothetical protein [uncultured Thiodictyon sp.]
MGLIADLLKEIPSAARYKADLEAMEKESVSLQAQIAVLRSENENLREDIQRRDNIVKEKESHSTRMDDVKHNLLACLAKGSKSEEEISAAAGLSAQSLYFHIEDPGLCKLFSSQSVGGLVTTYSINQAGRQYCAHHGLL